MILSKEITRQPLKWEQLSIDWELPDMNWEQPSFSFEPTNILTNG